jgi:threonine dehydratase
MGLSLSQFREARARLQDIINQTRLIYSSPFSLESGNEIYLKPENLQLTGSFKIRGAYNKICKLSPLERRTGLITSSAGNHAQGTAYAARKLDAKATIVMPQAAPPVKVEATKSYGARVVLAGDCFDEAHREADRLRQQYGYTFIHPFNDWDVIEGQGTISLEILGELPEADCIVAPIGGGGLISGVALAAKAVKPGIKIIGVEPEGAKAMKLSVESNRLVCLPEVNTIADGVAVKNPGDITFPIIRDYVDEFVTVSDFDIMDAFLLLLDKHKLVGESAGVLSLAALKKIGEKNRKTVCIISGGNIDVLTIASVIDRGLISRGRVFSFAVDLPDKPGELLKVIEILAGVKANIIRLDHNRLKNFTRFTDVELEVTVETNGFEHIDKITAELAEDGYSIRTL